MPCLNLSALSIDDLWRPIEVSHCVVFISFHFLPFYHTFLLTNWSSDWPCFVCPKLTLESSQSVLVICTERASHLSRLLHHYLGSMYYCTTGPVLHSIWLHSHSPSHLPLNPSILLNCCDAILPKERTLNEPCSEISSFVFFI